MLDQEAIVFSFPTIIKARHDDGGRRIVEVEASNEYPDSEGDVVLQQALLDSADSFIKSGHLDIDHISEIGDRYGVPNPMSYIVGVPLEVKDLGGGRTSVVCEISQDSSGLNVKKNKFDEFWESLKQTPGPKWQSSIYGYPKSGQVDDCSETQCSHGATRYLIKGLDWRSLAFTRNPVNTALRGNARIITAKAHVEHILKSMDIPVTPVPDMFNKVSLPPRSMDELWGQYERHIKKDCQMSGGATTRIAFKSHFQGCCGLDPEQSNILAHALMMMVLDKNKRRT